VWACAPHKKSDDIRTPTGLELSRLWVSRIASHHVHFSGLNLTVLVVTEESTKRSTSDWRARKSVSKFKGARLRYFRQFQHWSNFHRINLDIKIAAQNYRRTRTKHRKYKTGRGWTKLEKIEVDCIWINLKHVGPPFFKFTAVCQFMHVSNFH